MHPSLYMLEKEFIEHKIVTRVPLFVFICIILMFVGIVTSSDFQGDISYQFEFSNQSSNRFDGFSSNINLIIGSAISSISILLSALYIPKTLRKERQEGSSMFWRSMPVSHALTHWVKLGFGLLVIPLICSGLVLSTNLLYWLTDIATNHQLSVFVGQISLGDVLLNWLDYLARMLLVAVALLPIATVAIMTSQLVNSPLLVLALISFAANYLSQYLLGTDSTAHFFADIFSITGNIFSNDPFSGFTQASSVNLAIYYLLGVLALMASLTLSKTSEVSLKALFTRN